MAYIQHCSWTSFIKKIMIYRSCPPQITFSITLSRCPIPQINASLFPIAFDFSFSISQALCLKSKWVQLYSYGGVYTWLTQEHQNLTPARYQKLASSQETDCVDIFSHYLKHWWLFKKNIFSVINAMSIWAKDVTLTCCSKLSPCIILFYSSLQQLQI